MSACINFFPHEISRSFSSSLSLSRKSHWDTEHNSQHRKVSAKANPMKTSVIVGTQNRSTEMFPLINYIPLKHLPRHRLLAMSRGGFRYVTSGFIWELTATTAVYLTMTVTVFSVLTETLTVYNTLVLRLTLY